MENYIRNGEQWLTELLNLRDWLYDIRQEDNQGLPQALKTEMRFSGFLLRTRREILQKLLSIQNKVNTELISTEELEYVQRLLERDFDVNNDNNLKQFVFDLRGKVVTVISDFDLSNGSRKRLGSLSFNGAKLVTVDEAPAAYSSLTRIAYRLTEH